MADREIRIPVTIDLKSTKSIKQTTVKSPEVSQEEKRVEKVVEKASFGQALTAGLLIDSTKKLLSASGNSKATEVIEKGMRYGTLAVRSIGQDYTAMITLVIEILSEILKSNQANKQEATVNNQAKYNQIISGQVYLGNNAFVTTDRYGNNTYQKK
jgi:hypothetical protein